MSTPDFVTPGPDRGLVPARAAALAARLSALFDTDRLIVERLNDAQRRLSLANERLWSGLHPDAFGLIYDGVAPAGHSQIAALGDATNTGEPGCSSPAQVLCALQNARWAIHGAFIDYRSGCEQRRQLAFDVGELSERLTDALCAAGWSEQDARSANVHELAGGQGR